MAGSSTKDIKLRIKSVQSTMQITKAMELVASSKLRRARERVERSRPYFNELYRTLNDIAGRERDFSSDYLTSRPVNKAVYIIIAGDRGLAGGYNNNIFKMFTLEREQCECRLIPIGKKAVEFAKKTGLEIITENYGIVEDIDLDSCRDIRDIVCDIFRQGQADKICVLYTTFVSMLSQRPDFMQMLPIEGFEEEAREKRDSVTLFEPESEELFDKIVPRYVSGIIWGAITESWASELAARRTAMDSASKNAEDMVDSLSLQYNRARQAAITQEITEIVGGAGDG